MPRSLAGTSRKPRCTPNGAMHLARQGFKVYLPRYRKQRRHARRIDVVAAPLFPRYLFVSVDHGAQRWQSIQSTIGIARLIRNGGEPGIVSPEIVERLRDREDGRFRFA